MYDVSSCRSPLAELEYRWCVLQRAVPGQVTLLARHIETAANGTLSGIAGRAGLNPRAAVKAAMDGHGCLCVART
jgi:hypothetical protein